MPPSKPFALHIASAAATQSGAPLGATLHFSWPRTTRVLGRRATASAAALVLSTVVRGGDAGFMAEILEPVAHAANAGVEIVRRLVEPAADLGEKALRFWRAASWPASCAAASAELKTIAAASSPPNTSPDARVLGGRVKALLSMTGQTDITSVVFA